MVSIRRLRLLGRRSGVQNAVTDAPVNAAGEDDDINLSPAASAPPMLLHDLNLPPTEVDDQDEGCSTPNVVVRSQTEEQNAQLTVCGSSSSQDPAAPEEVVVRRRKQYRRRGAENLESKRGVYFKNSKWQAAIKVDKKQIHLGTLNSQKEAVQLYDRAAFMRGREPNYELTEEAKKELQKLQWEDFLAMTRKAMQTNRTRKRRVKRPAAADSDQGSEEEGEQAAETLSTSDDAEAD